MRTYIVQSKDAIDADAPKGKRSSYQPESFDDVAAKLGVDPDELFAANRDALGSTPDNIAIGMTLVVPDAPAGETAEADSYAAGDYDGDRTTDGNAERTNDQQGGGY